MARPWQAVAAIIIAGLLLTEGGFAEKISDRTTSSSGQFIVFSADQRRAGAVAKRAEEIKQDLLRLFNIQDNWKHIVLIQLIEREIYHKSSAPFLLTMHDSVDGTIRVQLDIAAAGPVDTANLVREILRGILLEMIYRKDESIAGKIYQYPPNWLVEALLTMLKSQDEHLDAPIFGLSDKTNATKIDAPVFGQLIKSGDTPKLNDLLDKKSTHMDATTRLIYRAQAVALLRAWLETAKGKQEVLNYLLRISRTEASRELLLACFTASGGSETKLVRLWTLALARYSATDRMESFSVEETEKSLAKTLTVSLPVTAQKKEKSPKENALITFAHNKDSKITFQQMQADLLRLNIRAHPLYRPIVQEYVAIIGNLARGKLRKMEKSIEEMESA
ncbi:MAG: hypothetical protein ABIP97_00415, partial [Chthoniobacterales bacterium]